MGPQDAHILVLLTTERIDLVERIMMNDPPVPLSSKALVRFTDDDSRARERLQT